MSKRISGRICLECKHCYMDGGDSGWSEWTPGYPPEWVCRADGVNLNFATRLNDGDKRGLIEDLQRAETCEHFEEEARG